jgi:hypothetical protein
MSSNFRRARPALSLVAPLPDEAGAPRVYFCGHCATKPDPNDINPPISRVCPTCGLGLLLECGADVAPTPGDPFLVLDGSLSVCAVSAAAEVLLGILETDAVNHHFTELLVPADAESRDGESLAVAITWAAGGDGTTRRAVVRPASTFGVRLTARIASCGPPRAALLVFE